MNESTSDYTVHHTEHGVYVLGYGAPADEMSNLLRAWDYRQLRHVSHTLMKRLGALIVVTRGTGYEAEWLRILDSEVDNEKASA